MALNMEVAESELTVLTAQIVLTTVSAVELTKGLALCFFDNTVLAPWVGTALSAVTVV